MHSLSLHLKTCKGLVNYGNSKTINISLVMTIIHFLGLSVLNNLRVIANSSQLVRTGLTYSNMQLSAWVDNFSMLFWLFYFLLCDVLSLSNLQITLALCLLLNLCTIEYLVLHDIFFVRRRPIIFHLIISFFYLL